MPLTEQFAICSVLKCRLLDIEQTNALTLDEDDSWRDSMVKGSLSRLGSASRLDVYIPVRSSSTATIKMTTQSNPMIESLLDE